MTLLLMDAQYLPSLSFFARAAQAEAVILDDREPFQKQTGRSRTTILGANGPLMLSIPVAKGKTLKTAGEVEIDNKRDWQRVHWISIQSAYGKAPFFEHYAPELQPFYEKPYSRLFDFNFKLAKRLMHLLQLPAEIMASSIAMKDQLSRTLDFRSGAPGNVTEQEMPLREVPYLQVFSERFGFIPGLSVLDLLMNEGPLSSAVLKR